MLSAITWRAHRCPSRHRRRSLRYRLSTTEIDCRRDQSSAVHGMPSNTDDGTPITHDARRADSPI